MGLPVTDYNSLLQAVIDTAEDNGAEFAAYIPVALDMAEEYLFRDLDLPILEGKQPGSLATGINTVTKPVGYKFANYLKIVINGANVFLKKRRDDYLQDYWPDPTQKGQPKYYSDSSSTVFLLAPTPDFGYAYELKYTAKPTKLSLTNTTNYYTANCQDILFYALMTEMTKFMKAWTQVQVWSQLYTSARDTWNVEQMRYRRDDGSTPRDPTNGPNDIKHTLPTNA